MHDGKRNIRHGSCVLCGYGDVIPGLVWIKMEVMNDGGGGGRCGD